MFEEMFEKEKDEDGRDQEKKASFLRDFWNAFKLIATNGCTRYILMAGFFRFFGGYCIVFYTPQFFQQAFPAQLNEFSIANALATLILCFISVFLGGIISDNYRPFDPMTKTHVQLSSCLLATPFVVLCYSLSTVGFWFSLSMLATNYLFAEAWSSPTITMLLDAAP